MKYISVSQYAEKFGISERTARNYCANGKIEGAFLTGKTWNIPEEVHRQMKALLSEYNHMKQKSFEDILDFHVRFEQIHPFQDGNGRVGRLLMFKECLANGHVPFIITDELKMFYYRGLREWGSVKGYLTDTCLTAQDQYKALMEHFGVK